MNGMKPRHEWDEEFILNLPRGEFDWLEVKGRRGLDLNLPNVRESDVLHNLSRELSAAANSGGGVLIYGLKDPAGSATGWQVDDGGVDTTYKKDTREWLGNVIPPLLNYELRGFNVYAITPTGPTSQIQAGRALYLIDIPDSPDAPHQADDKRYYIRAGLKTVPIGHRLVMDIMGRRQHPVIELEFSIAAERNPSRQLNPLMPDVSPLLFSPRRDHKASIWYDLVIRANNSGRVYAQYVNAFILVPVTMLPDDEIRDEEEFVTIDGLRYREYRRDNTVRDQVGVAGPQGPARYAPIPPGLVRRWTIELREDWRTRIADDTKIIWSAYADNAQPNKGEMNANALLVERTNR